MVEAFGKVQMALTGALTVAQSLFDGIPGSVQMIISATALAMVVKFFILPIVGPQAVFGGASDQVKKTTAAKANKRNRERKKGGK